VALARRWLPFHHDQTLTTADHAQRYVMHFRCSTAGPLMVGGIVNMVGCSSDTVSWPSVLVAREVMSCQSTVEVPLASVAVNVPLSGCRMRYSTPGCASA